MDNNWKLAANEIFPKSIFMDAMGKTFTIDDGHRQEYRRADLAFAPTPPGDNGWRDIATAPRDGEWIMAWWPTMSITQYPCICYSDGSLSNPNAFETVATNEYGSEEVYPAKWQPLPPPPAPPTGKGE